LVVHFSELFLLTASLRRRRKSMYISLFTVANSVNYTSEFQERFEAATDNYTNFYVQKKKHFKMSVTKKKKNWNGALILRVRVTVCDFSLSWAPLTKLLFVTSREDKLRPPWLRTPASSFIQQATKFHRVSVNAISLMPLRKVQPSLWWFSQSSQILHSVTRR
jgi:hypothetical protein